MAETVVNLDSPNPSRQAQEAEPARDPFFSFLVRVISLGIYLGSLIFILYRFSWGSRFVNGYPWIIAVVAVPLLVGLAVKPLRSWLVHSTAQGRIGVVIFCVVPMVLLGVGCVIALPIEYQALAIRIMFLSVVCSLPALLYYLFIATKKYSLLNEFIINLDRLGLRDPRRLPPQLVPPGLAFESEDERKNRIYTYIQKFEAVYGAIPTDLGGLVLDPANSGQWKMDSRMSKTDSGFSGLFTMDTTVPVLLATMLIALGWLVALPPWQGQLKAASPVHIQVLAPSQQQPLSPSPQEQWQEKWLNAFSPIQTPVQFAFIGAYFFSLQMLFRRYVRRDLRASAYVSVSLRIILSVIGIWVVIAAASKFPEIREQLVVLGFVIGVFPRVAWQVLQAFFKRFTGAALLLPSLQTQLPISDLDGLTVWHEARFEEEDIENIPNMATADLVDLMIETRLPPDRIIDWVDQAILYTQLGPEPAKQSAPTRRSLLRIHGIRTASSLVNAYQKSETRGDLEVFEKILPSETGGRSPIRSLVDTVATNPNLLLIQIWRGLYQTQTDQPTAG